MIILYNANEPYEFESALSQAKRVPVNLPVLMVSNFMDLGPITDGNEPECVSQTFCGRVTPVYFCKSSMETGRGLSMIYKWMNVPYLYIREKELGIGF